jgi:hypothetical protein
VNTNTIAGGQQLQQIDEAMETAAEAAEGAAEELTKAREHQKSTQKLKIILGSICGCIALAIIISVVLSVTPGTPLNPSTVGDIQLQSMSPSSCQNVSVCECVARLICLLLTTTLVKMTMDEN